MLKYLLKKTIMAVIFEIDDSNIYMIIALINQNTMLLFHIVELVFKI